MTIRKPPLGSPIVDNKGTMIEAWSKFFLLLSGDLSNLQNTGKGFSAKASTAQTLTKDVFTLVSFDTEDFDTSNEFDSATNYRYTPQTSGKYQVNAFVGISYTNANKITALALYKNGSRIKQTGHVTGNATYTTRNLSALVTMNGTTDYLDVRIYHNDSVDATLDNASYASHFSAFLTTV